MNGITLHTDGDGIHSDEAAAAVAVVQNGNNANPKKKTCLERQIWGQAKGAISQPTEQQNNYFFWKG